MSTMKSTLILLTALFASLFELLIILPDLDEFLLPLLVGALLLLLLLFLGGDG